MCWAQRGGGDNAGNVVSFIYPGLDKGFFCLACQILHHGWQNGRSKPSVPGNPLICCKHKVYTGWSGRFLAPLPAQEGLAANTQQCETTSTHVENPPV